MVPRVPVVRSLIVGALVAFGFATALAATAERREGIPFRLDVLGTWVPEPLVATRGELPTATNLFEALSSGPREGTEFGEPVLGPDGLEEPVDLVESAPSRLELHADGSARVKHACFIPRRDGSNWAGELVGEARWRLDSRGLLTIVGYLEGRIIRRWSFRADDARGLRFTPARFPASWQWDRFVRLPPGDG